MLVRNIGELENFTDTFLKTLIQKEDTATVVGLSGELGSGKTTFVQSVARTLGVKEILTSPTFVILKTYNLKPTTYNKNFDTLVHVDAYRLDSADELARLDWDKYVKDPANLIFVEWPEHVESVLPEDRINFSFKHIDETTREITRNDV